MRRDKGELRNSVHQIPSNADCPYRDWPSVSRLDGREKIDDVAWRARANVFSWPDFDVAGTRPERQLSEDELPYTAIERDGRIWPTSADLRVAQSGSVNWGTSDVPAHVIGTAVRDRKLPSAARFCYDAQHPPGHP